MDEKPRASRVPRTWLVVLSLPILAVLLWLGSREGALGLAQHTGYALCHQIVVRTYVFGELTMPLCARCSGQYLGFLVGLVMAWRWGRLRATGWPSRPLAVVLIVFLGVWAVDGLNSYLYLLFGRAFLYLPHNTLRLATGELQGLAVCFLFLPAFNQAFWLDEDPRPLLARGRHLLAALAVAALIFLAVHSRWLPLFYPLAFLSAAGALLLLSMVGTIFLLLILHQEQTNSTWRDLLAWLLSGMAFAGLFLAGVGMVRGWAEAHLGLIVPSG